MSSIININKASLEVLANLPGIGQSLAERIVAYRVNVGPFRTIDELAAVSGINEALIARLREQLAVTDPEGNPPEVKASYRLIVRLVKETDHPFLGHEVRITYTQRSELKRSDGSGQTLWVHGSQHIPVPADGKFEVSLPDKADLKDAIFFRVHAPDGEMLRTVEIAAAELSPAITITFEPKSFAAIQPNQDPQFGKPTRVKGRIIDRTGKRQAAGVQVVLWGASKEGPGPADFRALVVVNTDANGYFSGPYPVGRFTEAHGTVAVAEESESVVVHLEEDGSYPESIILVVDMDSASDPKEDDCACESGAMVPRDPDARDLVRADGTFSSDPGAGRCVDFTKPERTLEEFSYSYVVRTTEPAIKGLALEEPDKIDIRLALEALASQARQAAVTTGEKALPMVSATQSPGMPTTAFSTNFIEAKTLHVLARDPDGFSLTQIAAAADKTVHADFLRLLGQHILRNPGRGRLDCSNPVDWDDEPTIYQACTISHGHVLRFKQEWVSDGYSMGNLLYSLPLAPGQKKQIAIVDWDRRENNRRTEFLSLDDELDAEIERDRDISEIVNGAVNESVRGGSKSESGAFAGGLGIGAIIGPVGGLLGIGGGKSSASSSAWQNSSRNTSLNALNQLRDRTSQSASSVRTQRSTVVQSSTQNERVTATTETIANYNHCHAITIQYFEVLRHMLVRQRLADVQECLFVPLLMTRFTPEKVLRWRNTLRPALRTKVLKRSIDALERIGNNYEGSDLPTGRYADENIEYMEGELYLRFQIARPADGSDGFDPAHWSFMLRLLSHVSARDFYEQWLENQQQKDRIFQEQLTRQIVEQFVNHLKFVAISTTGAKYELPIDATLVSNYANDRPLYVSLRIDQELPVIKRSEISQIVISDKSSLAPGILLSQLLPANSKVIVERGAMRYRTKYASNYLFNNGRIKNDLAGNDEVLIFTPLNRQELRNPREEDKELARNLLDHLNEHIEHYHHRIWWRMSPSRRFMLLDGFQAPNSGGRSVASVVENELIGIVGNSLILPVANGFHLDPTFSQDDEEPINLLEHYQPTTPIDPMRIAIPTKGVYAEAVMGACNSCEVKEEERFWRWEESPIPDSPTPIQPVNTDTRRADPPDLTAKDFPASLINLQNAPAAPDPTGLASAMQLLGAQGLFKDITGLEGTQRNAAQALDSAFSAAQFFGGKAADLALQGKMSKDVDKAIRTIQKARESGLIDEKTASSLTSNAIRGLIGAGAEEKAEAMTTESVKSITETAGKNSAAVSLSRPGGERVEVDARPQQDAAAPSPAIVLSGDTGNAETRAFRPSSADKSGLITVEARFNNAPPGASLRWSSPGGAALAIDSPTSGITRVKGLKPGRRELDVELKDAGGNTIANTRLQLSVPQYVSVGEEAAAFDQALTDMQLADQKAAVVSHAKEVVDHLLGKANVRTYWNVGSFSEALPAHVPATNVVVVTIRNSERSGLFGRANGPGGPEIFNETIDIFPGAYSDAGSIDIDTETQALALQLVADLGGNPALKDVAAKVFGRLIGETMAHEIVHGVLWALIPGGHNHPEIPNDLMNEGSKRYFRQRTGMENTVQESPVQPDHYIDHGVAAIGGLQIVNQALIDQYFPVPPAI